MELGAKGSKGFLRIMRLAGIPDSEKEIMVTQKGSISLKRKVMVAWEG